MFLPSVVLLLLPLSVLATPLSSRSALYADYAVKHSWGDSTPSDAWVHHSTPDPSKLLKLRFGLRPSNFDTLIGHLSETSDPFHERYGKHLSKEQVDELMRPTDETLQEVKEWLSWHGIKEDAFTSNSDRWITVNVPVSLAETLLNTKYHVYAHTGSDEKVIRTLEYSLPRHLHDHISLVSPTTYFGTAKSMKVTSHLEPDRPALSLSSDVSPPSTCSRTITPTCLKDLYNTVNYTPTQTASNKIGITGYLEQFASNADLTTFTESFLPGATNATFTLTEINGGLNTQNDPGVEANLDVQYATGMSFPTPMIFYSTGGEPPFIADDNTPTNTNEPYLNWLDFITGVPDNELPNTFSTSYGDDEQSVPADYATEVCNLLATLGARGASVMFSSGDAGVGGGSCETNDGTNRVIFQPAFPASCPFVTAVGATTGIAPEVAVNEFPSGGGFSRLFAQPSYQASAVSGYLAKIGSTNAGLFNASGRAYPDVAAQGENFQVVVGGRVESVGGTSCSSPTFAGIIALLNDFKLSQNGTTLGFLNPLLYAKSDALNDVTSGSNPGCGTNGFTTSVGWDPVTGLGTPDFVKLQAIV
ncbi:peptidase S8/S53 domain-containing protein [Lentinula raphanica]|uniref:tripeptidyl-peptidase II n=1 Tax=Lentinula raphanica TaxID=153919 RepID=A0AA38P685_9AGAR|nr:peptidase S8/S53 domain-containing protein [Lentinula raphanica]KAJ3837097.1 peptidase S8/S53 domain-containing protein [Lentinula raphanica]KAJ3973123.1 peptidase S8/S53 domain-containing protein [Lentinula raphanica]